MTITKTRDHFDHMVAEYKKDEAERAQLMALFGGGKVPAKRAHPGAAVDSSTSSSSSSSSSSSASSSGSLASSAIAIDATTVPPPAKKARASASASAPPPADAEVIDLCDSD